MEVNRKFYTKSHDKWIVFSVIYNFLIFNKSVHIIVITICLMTLSTQLIYQKLQLKWVLLLLLEKSFQVNFPWISLQHKFWLLWRNSVQCMQAHKIGKPIFIKEVGRCIFMHSALCKSGNHKTKGIKNSRSFYRTLWLVHFYVKRS